MRSRPWHTTSFFIVLQNKNGQVTIFDRGKISNDWRQEHLEVYSENVINF